MCLIALAWQAHPDYPLVVAANRDEFFARPAAAAHWWPDLPDLLAGRDLEGGGTWMGVSRDGRFAALTNYRDPSLRRDGVPSRGLLVRDCLTAPEAAEPTLAGIARHADSYAAFNLLVGDGERLGAFESVTGRIHMLAPGIYGLSNHLLDTPWPKVRQARERLATALGSQPDEELDEEAILALLRDGTPAAEADLPHTGVGAEWERWLSPAFIRAPGYGTRCSTMLTVRRDGQVRLREWTWTEDGDLAGEATHGFAIDGSGQAA
ncbi:NRDE family protein [Pseudothauera rhizosphaerae]|uniref:NRDE family protein n=1 Tax=Pseudothauera rhizosphaerae TaxID=2565932 RepID=A0A4S4AC29_9RHOO|nr:NRDE family protein [Pseudothauera rhizosphaerae]THF56519.1 NRDE family protein [Pseudothauera rhizosphaerae]